MKSFLGKAAKLTGNLSTCENIRIDGEFEGEIVAQSTVVVGKSGKVKGEIKADNFQNYGLVQGGIAIKEKTELFEKSRLEGDILTKCLLVKEGASFQGSSVMSPKTTGKKN